MKQSVVNLSIVIVSWNVKDLLGECLKSIYENKGDLKIEIIVVDNASSDQTVEMVKEKFKNVKLIANANNLGFSRANNQGIEISTGEYILALNPDTKVLPDTLKKMVDFMDKNYKIGISGCKHLNPNLTLQPSVRRFPTVLPILLILTKIAKIIPGIRILRDYFAKDFDYKITQPAQQVAGSFFMIRAQTIEEIGVFDESFFIWFEEVDYCKRAKEAGWQIWFNSDAEIIHYGGQSFEQKITLEKQLLFFKSAMYYFKKHGLIWKIF